MFNRVSCNKFLVPLQLLQPGFSVKEARWERVRKKYHDSRKKKTQEGYAEDLINDRSRSRRFALKDLPWEWTPPSSKERGDPIAPARRLSA
jgi:hypothetical protein